MFSVVIPLYNKELSVRNTINSVLDQTFKEFEVIIVNDGSTDNSLEIVQQFKDDRIRIIDKANGGVSSARNRGIKEAKYEWIAFLDADDLWVDNHLESYYEVINTNLNITWAISGFIAIKGHKQWINVYDKNGILNNVFEDLIRGLTIHTSTVCIRKKLFIKYPDLYFREGLNNSEDREVWYKLCCIDKNPYYIKKALSKYDLGVSNSLTKQNIYSKSFPFLTMYERMEKFLNLISHDDSLLFQKFIKDYNILQIKAKYIQRVFSEDFKNHISKGWYFILIKTIWLPKIIKKIFIRLT